MLNGFLLKALLNKQLSALPPETRDLIVAAVEKDPGLFMKIAEEVKQKTASGKPQMEAMQEVFTEHTVELEALLKPAT